MKATMHKSCSCRQCKLGRSSKAGQSVHRLNEHRLRRITRQQVQQFLRGAEDIIIAPISSPYTD